ncbi:malate synthase A [Microlunatus panaciterrae]|uniref:Malate synthase n=1 Tax=Microlunatus panaciterrae TaxID=400768 RepID=A0ABS2RG26_9ACTN|nr:malate synthase A [Microlunatus panaciterrae]MBM7797955.1 malate synthase [Microlunatus panaciterrae]
MTIIEQRPGLSTVAPTPAAPATTLTPSAPSPSGRIVVHGAMAPRFEQILTPAALDFVAELHRLFAGRRAEILDARRRRHEKINAGLELTFRPDTEEIRRDPGWRVAYPGPGLEDRRCEITGPTSRKMTVSALNSGARVWMADFEDATSPTWFNVVDGQLNLYDAIRRQIDFTAPDGRRYALVDRTPTIMVRPRGWHLCEKHLTVDGQAIPAAFVDFGLYFFHNARTLIRTGRGPYFYLPKLQSHHEARLWNDIFCWAQQQLRIPHGTIRATCLIETFPAAFEMEEILYELRDHSAGLNAGRWDYIFSMIKNSAERADRVLPDRSQVTMTAPFMRAYTELLVKTCHARGAHAIGGMAAFVPGRDDPAATAAALERTRADKVREVSDGFDGSWVAHPLLVDTCTRAFNQVLGERPHQLGRRRDDVSVTAAQLGDLSDVGGTITMDGVRTNIRVSLQYLAAWVGGQGAVAIDHLMEDAATVEISRMQLWQWIRHQAVTIDGTAITHELVASCIDQEMERLADPDDSDRHTRLVAARDILEHSCLVERWPSFFTTYAYATYLVHRVTP